MRARKVKGLDPDGPLDENLRRIVLVRLDELHSFVPAVLDPDEQDALHHMRIAAKRLRYILEVAAPLFGPGAERGAKEARKLQDLIGDIHDCDVSLPIVHRHAERLRTEDAAAVRAAAGARAKDVSPALLRDAPNRRRYRGLELLAVHLEARRDVLYARFLEEWARLEREDLRGTVQAALADVGTIRRDG